MIGIEWITSGTVFVSAADRDHKWVKLTDGNAVDPATGVVYSHIFFRRDICLTVPGLKAAIVSA